MSEICIFRPHLAPFVLNEKENHTGLEQDEDNRTIIILNMTENKEYTFTLYSVELHNLQCIIPAL